MMAEEVSKEAVKSRLFKLIINLRYKSGLNQGLPMFLHRVFLFTHRPRVAEVLAEAQAAQDTIIRSVKQEVPYCRFNRQLADRLPKMPVSKNWRIFKN